MLTLECEGLISFSSTGTELDPNGSRRKERSVLGFMSTINTSESLKAGAGMP